MKTYLRYAEECCWGVVVSSGGNIAVDASGRVAITPSLETVAVWNVKTGELTQQLKPAENTASAEVSALELGADTETLAVGYSDGVVRLWHLSDGTERVTLNGHKSAVSALRLNRQATLLVSGARDTNIALGRVGRVGVCRLRGHRDAITISACYRRSEPSPTSKEHGACGTLTRSTVYRLRLHPAASCECGRDEGCERLLTGGKRADASVAPESVARKGAPRGQRRPSPLGTLVQRPSLVQLIMAVARATRRAAVRASTSRVSRLRRLDDAVVAVQFADERNLRRPVRGTLPTQVRVG